MERAVITFQHKLASSNAGFNRKRSNTKLSQSQLPDSVVKGKIKVGRDKRKEGVWDGGEHTYSLTDAEICNSPIYGILGTFQER